MTRMPKKKAKPSVAANSPSQADFDAVLGLIEAARTKAITAVNTTMIELYWSIGEFISRKTAEDGWGQGTVKVLAETIQRRYPGTTGFSARNLWRMSQFFQTYRDRPKLSPLVTELSWTHNLLIMSRSKRDEEREFYLRLCIRERWGKRELERQLAGALFERVVLSPAKISPVVASVASRCRECLQGQLPDRVCRPPRESFRKGPSAGVDRELEAVPHRARPRLLLRRQPVPAPGRRARLRH